MTNAVAVAPGGLEQRILCVDVSTWPGSSGAPIFSRTGQVADLVTGVMRSTCETTVRDSRWMIALLKMAVFQSFCEAAYVGGPFPRAVSRRVYVTRMKPEVWSQRLRRFANGILC